MSLFGPRRMGDQVSKLKHLSSSDMEEQRFFQNQNQDYVDQAGSGSGSEERANEPLDEEGKVSASFQKKVQSKIKDLWQQMEEGLKTADPHDFSTYTGWTGIALLYLQLHRCSQESSHLQRALDYVKRTLRILNGRKVSFLCGDAGPLAVGAVVHHKLRNTEESQDCLNRVQSSVTLTSLMNSCTVALAS
ncbi:lanC-like protein 2 isoform X3 [Trematomus bernacchii]|uniref:lanC-like protein 2 isoform X3 n=2 Tax=Trematomus bernacchii TaxID=40690 RepID=UPI00146B409E|nr:lanC-like protein 2 isoform X3 [Trematomus bernacchii]